MAAFEERVTARFDAAFVNGSALGWIARNTSKPKRDWKVDLGAAGDHRVEPARTSTTSPTTWVRS